jgi:drug/metabolite transporter (DMT)-like permease
MASLPESVLLTTAARTVTDMNRPSVAAPGLSGGVIAAFAAIYFVWGTTYLAMAFVIHAMPPFIAGATRFLLAGGLMYAWLRWRKPRPFEGVSPLMLVVTGVLLTGIGNGLIFFAQQAIPSGIAALIVGAVPVIVLVLDWAFFSKRQPTPQALFGTAIAIAGVVTIVLHTRTLSGNTEPMYVIAALTATVGWSFGTLLQKRAARPETVLSFTCGQMLVGGVFQLMLSVFSGEWQRFDPGAISLSAVLAVMYLVVFGSILTLNCYLWLLTRVAAPKVTTYALVNPVVALVLGALVLDERITVLAVVAAALVLVGVALVLFQEISPLALLRARRARVGASTSS